ncbi:cytochrome C biogenesis protein CcdA [Helicobacter didelphidarum]|uniref:Cytochrome C biogenesis protein CcdA n=1 Tax=Helicobacter didelphidarum TaxID=2040648 RepID=A0A3D8IP59_9HELI|nr:cytochrome c biogenesis protein CcdA [Helicobacter didelphidarum]RDU67077.1 cytochrome C biogenesis protein CcdA [Helicobacter didelphidarum]
MESLQQIFFELPILASFIGGILNFLTPCILPLIPSYMSYISGSSLESQHYSRVQTLRSALLFILGFSFIFFLLFLAMINIIENFFSYKIVHYVAGGIIVAFGLHFLGIFRINILNYSKQVNLKKFEEHRLLKSIAPFIVGVGFAAGWSPCTGPIVSSIGLLASSNQNLAIFSSLAFIVGLSLPFLLLALFLERGLNIVRKLKKQMRIIEIISGIFLIVIGISIALDIV